MAKFLTGETWVRHERLPGKPYFRATIGDAIVHVLPEASFTADPKGIFGKQGLLGDGEMARLAREAHVRPDGCLADQMMFGCMLLQIGGKTILLDSCLGEVNTPDYVPLVGEGPGRLMYPLLDSLRDHARVAPEEVDVVVHTHLHPDHIGWNVRHPPDGSGGKPVVTFPRAKHVIQRAEWLYPAKRFACPWREDWEVKCKPLEEKGMLKLVDGDFEVAPGVRLRGAAGHTPGHQVVRIESAGQVAYYIGDLLHTMPQVTWPELSPVFDCCGWSAARARKLERPPLEETAAVRHRKELLARIHAEGAWILSPHLPFPGIGHLVDVGAGRFGWAPIARPSGACWAACLAWCRKA